MAYPTVNARTETPLSASTTLTIDFVQNTGDLVVIFLGLNDTAQSLSTVGDSFTDLTNTNATFHVLYKVLTGSEGGNVAVTVGTSTKGAAIAYNIDANTFAPFAPAISTVATGTSTAPNATSCAPTGGAKDYLWISAFRQNGEEADDDTWCTAAPSTPGTFTNLTQTTTGTSSLPATNGSVASAEYTANTTSVDAGAFTTAQSLAWRAYTVAIYPANKVYAQANAKINAFGIQAYAQAGTHIKVLANKSYAQALATITVAGSGPAYVQHIGKGTSGTGITQYQLSVSKTITSGNKVVVSVAQFENRLSTVGVVDNLGNTYTMIANNVATSPLYLYMFVAPVTTGGTLTTITASWTGSTTYNTAIMADEFSGLGTASDGGDGTGNSTTMTWFPSGTISANGAVVGCAFAQNARTHYVGAASGSPSTTIYLAQTIYPSEPNISHSYAIAGGSDVTSFVGTTLNDLATSWIGTSVKFGPAAATNTYRGYAQAQTHIKVVANKSYAQAQALIKRTYPSTVTSTPALVQAIGSYNSGGVDANTIVLSVTKTITIGNVIVVAAAYDNTTAPTCADNLGNIYSRVEYSTSAPHTAALFVAPVTAGGSLTTITVTMNGWSTARTIIAAEYSGVGSLSVVGGGTTGLSGTATWANNVTIPANGIVFGAVSPYNSGRTQTIGAASGSPSTSAIIQTQITSGTNSLALCHAIAGGSTVTGFTGTTTFTSNEWASAGGVYSPSSTLEGPTFAQAQAKITSIKLSVAQAQAKIKQIYQSYAQAQVKLPTTVTTYPFADITTYARDSFTRSESNGWGTADVGGAWTVSANPSWDSVDGSAGKIAIATGSTSNFIRLDSISVADIDQKYSWSMDKLPTVASAAVHLFARRDSNNYYVNVRCYINPDATVTLNFRAFTSGGNYTLATETSSLGTYSVGDTWWLRFRVYGNMVYAKTWNSSSAEPTLWQQSADISSYSIPSTGSIGVWAWNSASIGNLPITYTYDNYLAQSPYDFPFGQAQASIKQAYKVYAQANTNIKTTYSNYAQSQAQIKTTYRGYALAQAAIKQTYPLGTRSPSYSSVILANSPNAYWRLGESSGTVADNAEGTAALDGAYIDTPTLGVNGAIVGDSDTAITLNGTSELVRVPNQSVLNVGNVFTYELWVRREDTSLNKGLICKGTNSAYLRVAGTTGIVSLNKCNVSTIVSSTVSLTSKWTHVVVTKNNSSVKLYFDGVDVSGTVTDATIEDTTVDLAIGSYIDDASTQGWFLGSIDEVAVYKNRVLTIEEILAHYAAGIKGATFAQSQATISAAAVVTYTAYAQAQTLIKQTYLAYAQSQANIKTTYIGYAQSQAQIKQTYRGYAQSQAQIKTTYRGYAQAQSQIKNTYRGYAQSQANIKTTYIGYAQSQAQIKQTYLVYAQSQASLQVQNNSYANAQAKIYIPIYLVPIADITTNGWVGVVI